MTADAAAIRELHREVDVENGIEQAVSIRRARSHGHKQWADGAESRSGLASRQAQQETADSTKKIATTAAVVLGSSSGSSSNRQASRQQQSTRLTCLRLFLVFLTFDSHNILVFA